MVAYPVSTSFPDRSFPINTFPDSNYQTAPQYSRSKINKITFSTTIKMAAVVKKNLKPRRTIHGNPKEINDEDRTFPFYFLIMMPNTIGMFVRAYRRNDYSLAVLGLLVLLSLALFDCCFPLYISIPKNEKSRRKFGLKLTMWFLYTALSFGYVFEFGYFLSFQITMALYAVAVVCSAFLLYRFIIVDLVNDWKSRSSGEEDVIGILEYQRLDFGKLKDSDSVLEKV